jgi:predicted transcriptional regulator
MPIGIVSDADLQKELASYSSGKRTELVVPDKVLEGTIIDKPARGRSSGDTNIPDSLRAIIGEDALLNGRASALQIAEDFGISPSSVSAYAKGATSTASYNEPKSSIIGHINKARERAIKRAGKTLNAALGSITQEKLDYTDPDKLSGIAKDMSVIIKNLEKQVEVGDVKQTPQFVIFAPQFRDERSFDVITVQE